MSAGSLISDKCPMAEGRRYASRPNSSTFGRNGASPADSGFGSTRTPEQASKSDSRATNRTSSSLSRDTPINDREETIRKEADLDKPGK